MGRTIDFVISLALLLGLALPGGSTAVPVAAAAPRGTAIGRPDPRHYFTEAEIARGKTYVRGRIALFAAGIALRLALLAALAVTPAASAIRDRAMAWSGGRPWLAPALVALVLLLAVELLALPLGFYGGYLRERAFGLSTQTATAWLWDRTKAAALTLALGVPCAAILYALIRRFPAGWPYLAAALGSALVILLVALAPILIDPLFHTFRPLADPGLRDRVLALARKAEIPVEGVWEMDASRRTRKGNAYFTGLGATRRIVLYDTLVRGASPEEVELVVAHEMGHWRRAHIWKGIALTCLALLVGLVIVARALDGAVGFPRLRLAGPADPAGLALIALVAALLGLLAMPAENALSRRFEREADLESLRLTGNPDAFIQSEVTLARTNLADVEPPTALVWLLYTHPPVMERISMAQAFARERGGG